MSTFFVCPPCGLHNDHGRCHNYFHNDDKFYCQCPVPEDSHRFSFFMGRIRELESRLAECEQQRRPRKRPRRHA